MIASQAPRCLLIQRIEQEVDQGVKEAAFRVLVSELYYEDAESRLMEGSFISNSAKETRHGDATYRQTIAPTLADEITDFLAEEDNAKGR